MQSAEITAKFIAEASERTAVAVSYALLGHPRHDLAPAVLSAAEFAEFIGADERGPIVEMCHELYREETDAKIRLLLKGFAALN